MSKTLILVEATADSLRKTTLPGITFGAQVAAANGGGFDLALIGTGVTKAAASAARYGAAKVYVVDHAAFEHALAESYATAIAEIVKRSGATLVAGASSSTTKDVFPRVAARLGAAMASEVTGVVDEKTFKRPMWAGNVTATVELTTPVKVCSVRATEFDAPAVVGATSPIESVDVLVDLGALRTKFVGLKEIKSERPELASADRIVSGGRGVKGPDGFRLVEQLADTLRAGVGASRAVCDAGWAGNDLQIGQTGKVVAPNLYIAVGISGAIQHLAGMKGSKVIVAINKDAEAPIFQVADYGLVADLFEAVPQLVAAIKQL
ncbi:MAG: electron transfer flavoprotein subunit alpha/FixB family protein [Myxococcota bacterium]